MNLIKGNNKKRSRRRVSLITMVMMAMAFMPAIVFADAALDDAVNTANKAVSAPAAMVMFIALLVMCFVSKKFYKK